MPNVIGLLPATDLIAAHPNGATKITYGPHAYVVIDAAGSATLFAQSDDRKVAAYDGTKPSAALSRIDSDTVTAVNAFLKPFGKVRVYWRAKPGEVPYRWHPLNGTAVSATPRPPRKASTAAPKPRRKATPKPVAAAPSAPVAEAPAPVAAPVATVVTAHPATAPVIETATTWADRFSKRPTAKTVTKTYSIVADVLIPTEDLDTLDSAYRQRLAGQDAHVLITGPRGTAKTRVAQSWGYVNDLEVVIVAGQSIQIADDWFGGVKPTGGGGFDWVWSDAALLIMTGRPCLIVIDELNRPDSAKALNGIMDLLDFRATAKPLNAPHAIRLVPGQMVIATLNEGIEYTATVEIDAAVRDRFSRGGGITMRYTSEAIESRIVRGQVPGIDATEHGPDVSKKLARIGAHQRATVNGKDGDIAYPSGTTLSTRALVGIADKIVTGGLKPTAAIWSVAKATFQPEDMQSIKNLIESQFGPDAAPIDDLADDDDIELMLDAHGV